MNLPGRDVGWKDFGKGLYRSWKEDAVGNTAAALTYYAMLSLFPFLLFVVALAGILLDPTAITKLIDAFGKLVPGQVSQIVGGRLTALEQNPSGGLLTLGIVLAIWSASSGVSSLMTALNRCYDVRETRPFWKTRPLAVGVTLVAGVVSVLTAAVMFFLPVVAGIIGGPIGSAILWLRFLVAGLLLLGLWAFFYWALPNVHPRFQLITPGSLFGVVAWLIASWGFTEYVRHSKSYEATYGTLGAVIILLVWMWISSLVLLLGAEINKVLTPAEKLKYESKAGEGVVSEDHAKKKREKKEKKKEEKERAPSGRPEPSPG